MLPEMNIEKDKQYQYYDSLIVSDDEARAILSTERPNSTASSVLLDIARDISIAHSFVDHQTYPRPSHPVESKRLDPRFTFVAIIVSLRCTLETEKKVVYKLVNDLEGDPNRLESLNVNELEVYLRPAGMARQKSTWITEGLVEFNTNQDYSLETLKQIPIDEARARLLQLRGMGPKAVDCFLLLGLDKPVFPVDVNVFKLVSRLFPKQIVGDLGSEPSFSNKRHVRVVKNLLESNFTKNTNLYQILHTYLLLAEKYKMVI